MGRKKKPEPHENLERWLVSYADFITLLFAVFVVLYALGQADVKAFKDIEESLKRAFAAPSLFQGGGGMFNSGSSIITSGADNSDMAVVPPLLEHLNGKYEEIAFNQIKDGIEEIKKQEGNNDIDVKIGERGISIIIVEKILFDSGSAKIKKSSIPTFKKIGQLISNKFQSRLIRVEGHTDDLQMKSNLYPSNWELSSARASSVVRFLIDNFKFKKTRFAAIGYADIMPIDKQKTPSARAKNRRVEIVILRNKYAKHEPKYENAFSLKQEPVKHKEVPKENKYGGLSDAAIKLLKESEGQGKGAIIIQDSYDEKSAEISRILREKEAKMLSRPRDIKFNSTHGEQDNKKSHNEHEPLAQNSNVIKKELHSSKTEQKEDSVHYGDVDVIKKVLDDVSHPLGAKINVEH